MAVKSLPDILSLIPLTDALNSFEERRVPDVADPAEVCEACDEYEANLNGQNVSDSDN